MCESQCTGGSIAMHAWTHVHTPLYSVLYNVHVRYRNTDKHMKESRIFPWIEAQASISFTTHDSVSKQSQPLFRGPASLYFYAACATSTRVPWQSWPWVVASLAWPISELSCSSSRWFTARSLNKTSKTFAWTPWWLVQLLGRHTCTYMLPTE